MGRVHGPSVSTGVDTARDTAHGHG